MSDPQRPTNHVRSAPQPLSDQQSRLKHKLPNQLVSWLGIFGGALTIVSNLQSVLSLSDWAHILISNWSTWVKSAWSGLLALFGVDVPGDFVLAWWTLSVFLLATALGARVAGGRAGDIHQIFRTSWTRTDIELLVLTCVLLGLLALPAISDKPGDLNSVALIVPPYIAAVTLCALVTDSRHLVRRLRLVIGAILMALALNRISVTLEVAAG